MPIPAIPNYNSLPHSGCMLKFLNFYNRKRIYGPVLEYQTIVIPVTSVFNFTWYTATAKITNYPIRHSFQHLSADSDIDYNSFISLN